VYGEDVMRASRKVWAVMDVPAGKGDGRPFLSQIVGRLRACGEPDLDDAQLCGISAATIDRRLAGERERLQPKGHSGTKPRSLLKAQTPISGPGPSGTRRRRGLWRSTWSAMRVVTLVGSSPKP
jgi:hypothetical protein